MRLLKGKVYLLTQGYHDDYGPVGLIRALRTFDLGKQIRAFRESYSDETQLFAKYLEVAGLVEQIPMMELNFAEHSDEARRTVFRLQLYCQHKRVAWSGPYGKGGDAPKYKMKQCKDCKLQFHSTYCLMADAEAGEIQKEWQDGQTKDTRKS